MPIEPEPRRYLLTGARGEDQNRKGRALAHQPVHAALNRLSLGARLTVGHPPLPVRKCRSESDAPSLTVGPTPFQRHRSRTKNPGLAPELMTLPVHIARNAPTFQRRVRAIRNYMDWPHEHPSA
jgi:hypothetical protein